MIYEYDYEEIVMSEQDRKLTEMNFIQPEQINPKIKEVLNRKAKGGWEPLYPFMVPMLWFKRVKKQKKN